ncbi:MAG: hypothetical protein CL795_05650 [Chloroflexi bacterium]|nr:hypothetical protein [Chloroflexota bacterium]
MELFVIRHTEVQNPNNLCYGNYDISLKPNYEHKSKIFFENLPNDLDQIYSSPSKRCTDLLDLHNLNFNIHNDLRELDFGDWEGKKWDDIDQKHLNYWMEDYVNRSPKNGEKMIDLYKRSIEFTYKLVELDLQKILLVTHAGVIRSLISEALSINLNQIFNVSINYDEIYRFQINSAHQSSLLFLDMTNIMTGEITQKLD